MKAERNRHAALQMSTAHEAKRAGGRKALQRRTALSLAHPWASSSAAGNLGLTLGRPAVQLSPGQVVQRHDEDEQQQQQQQQQQIIINNGGRGGTRMVRQGPSETTQIVRDEARVMEQQREDRRYDDERADQRREAQERRQGNERRDQACRAQAESQTPPTNIPNDAQAVSLRLPPGARIPERLRGALHNAANAGGIADKLSADARSRLANLLHTALRPAETGDRGRPPLAFGPTDQVRSEQYVDSYWTATLTLDGAGPARLLSMRARSVSGSNESGGTDSDTARERQQGSRTYRGQVRGESGSEQGIAVPIPDTPIEARASQTRGLSGEGGFEDSTVRENEDTTARNRQGSQSETYTENHGIARWSLPLSAAIHVEMEPANSDDDTVGDLRAMVSSSGSGDYTIASFGTVEFEVDVGGTQCRPEAPLTQTDRR